MEGNSRQIDCSSSTTKCSANNPIDDNFNSNFLPSFNEAQIEKICDKRIINNRIQYNVKWLGLSMNENKWVDESDIDPPELLSQYEESLRKTKRKKTMIQNVKKECPKSSEIVKPKKRRLKNKNKAKDIFEIEAISGKRIINGRIQYLIAWKNYPPSENSWVDIDHIDAAGFMSDFELYCDHINNNQRPNNFKKLGKFREKPGKQFVKKHEIKLQKKLNKKRHIEKENPFIEAENSDDDDDYEIDMIFGRRIVDGEIEYLVKWRDYLMSENSWVNSNFISAPFLIDIFEAYCATQQPPEQRECED